MIRSQSRWLGWTLLVLLCSCMRLGTGQSEDAGTDGFQLQDQGADQQAGSDVFPAPKDNLISTPKYFDQVELIVGQTPQLQSVITRAGGQTLPALAFAADEAWVTGTIDPLPGAASAKLTLSFFPELAERGAHQVTGLVYAPAGGVIPVALTLEVQVMAEIFRSVEPGRTTPLADGATNMLTLTGATADFVQPLPVQVGVGDVIQYDSNGDQQPDALAFIFKRVSATRYLVQDAAGNQPMLDVGSSPHWALFRAYTSLTDALVGRENAGISALLRDFDRWSDGRDLVAANERWNIACYSGVVDTTRTLITADWITGEQTFLKIYTPVSQQQVGVSQRHGGIWSETAYRMEVLATGNAAIKVEANHVWIDGLQIKGIEDLLSFRGIWASNTGPGARIRISNTIISGDGKPNPIFR